MDKWFPPGNQFKCFQIFEIFEIFLFLKLPVNHTRKKPDRLTLKTKGQQASFCGHHHRNLEEPGSEETLDVM